MIFELEAAWELLRPGGFLTGDDYTHYVRARVRSNSMQRAVGSMDCTLTACRFPSPRTHGQQFPPVQQALNEWVLSKPASSFVDPTLYATRWGKMQKMRFVRILVPGQETNASTPLSPFVLRLPGQWVLRKPAEAPVEVGSGGKARLSDPRAAQRTSPHILQSLHPMRHGIGADAPAGGHSGAGHGVRRKQTSKQAHGSEAVTDEERRAFRERIHKPLTCCLNGWANPDPEPLCSMWTSMDKVGSPPCLARRTLASRGAPLPHVVHQICSMRPPLSARTEPRARSGCT